MPHDVFSPVAFGDIQAANRIVMSPMGRRRAGLDGRPNDLMAQYYGQRASAGLIVTESTHPVLAGKGQPGSPHLIDAADAAAWARVTRAVHDRGGRILLQLMHAGSAAHPAVNGGEVPLAPSAVVPRETTVLDGRVVEHPMPREMTPADIDATVEHFARAAVMAVEAGFDGVEIHGGNGYLLHQFLASGTNLRRDEYGGPVENRCRFPIRVVEAVAARIGHGRVGVRISPGASANRLVEDDLTAVYPALLSHPSMRRIAYVHTVSLSRPEAVAWIRANWRGAWIHNMGADLEQPSSAVLEAIRDQLGAGVSAVSVGRLFISNPDLPERLHHRAPLTPPDPRYFYGGDSKGYTDYATWTSVSTQHAHA